MVRANAVQVDNFYLKKVVLSFAYFPTERSSKKMGSRDYGNAKIYMKGMTGAGPPLKATI